MKLLRTATTLLLIALPHLAAAVSISEGLAFSDQGTLLYREQHLLEQRTSGAVRYLSPEGALLANKQLEFNNPYCPGFSLTDGSGSPLYGITETNGGYLFQLQGHSSDKNLFTASTDRPLVCDGGFDFYIKDLLSQNSSSSDLSISESTIETSPIIDFALPTRSTLVQMEINLLQATEVPEQLLEKINGHCECADTARVLKINPHTWWLKWLAEPLYLAYNANNELLVFVGPSNLPMFDEAGTVTIYYRHSISAPAPLVR